MKFVLFLIDMMWNLWKQIQELVESKELLQCTIRWQTVREFDIWRQKKFLAFIETKKELTRYLADKLAADLEKDFVVVFDRSCFSNLADLEESLKTYGQEEADTGIVLHAIDVCRRDPFSELTISCSDTDVLLIVLNYFKQLPSITIFKTTEHC